MTTSAAAAQVQLTGWLASVVVLAVVVCAVLSLLAVHLTREAQRTREEACRCCGCWRTSPRPSWGSAGPARSRSRSRGDGLAARGTRDSRRTRVVGREIEDAIDRRTAR